MSKQIPQWQLHQILVAFLFDWSIKCITAAIKLYLSTIYQIQLNLDLYGEAYPPYNLKIGRLRAIDKVYEKALIAYLEDRLTAFLNKMAWFLWDDYDIIVSFLLIWRTL
ncbi:uncharacterized protein K441DRAFT_727094 [Cenococcum geophilum 1.58]|uniref:uncharacterized protein n=1 Tax=Cenococcum geophilum 1.58 TaxID=794803 RepID=UPI00358E0396|nr:hypothetical protein K441DRAFT_727094 [Cenococcum geophilum 1.58]